MERLINRWLPDNPAGEAEALYQGRHSRNASWLWRWLRRLLMAYSLGFTAFMVSFILLVTVFGLRITIDQWVSVQPWAVAAIVIALGWHFLLIFRTLVLSANSLSREHSGKTWELLLLTDMDARAIVRGKFAATVWRMLPAFGWLALARIGPIFWLGFNINLNALMGWVTYSNAPYLTITSPHPLQVLLAAGLVTALTFINLMFTAACGMLGGARSQRSEWALLHGAGLRLRPAGLYAVIALGIFLFSWATRWDIAFYNHPGISPELRQTISELILTGAIHAATTLDNGAFVGSGMVSVRITTRYGDEFNTDAVLIVSAILSLLLYTGFTWFTLWGAERRALRAGALKPEKRKRESKKKKHVETALPEADAPDLLASESVDPRKSMTR